MSLRDNIEKRTEELASPIFEELGLKCYDVAYEKEGSDYYLRIYIDKDGGVDLNDCEAVSQRMNEILDAEDYIKDAYIFEVSSPGLTRKLTRDRHFANSIGEKVDIKLYKPVDKVKTFEGILVAFDDKTVTIETESGEMQLDRSNLAGVKLHFEI